MGCVCLSVCLSVYVWLAGSQQRVFGPKHHRNESAHHFCTELDHHQGLRGFQYIEFVTRATRSIARSSLRQRGWVAG